MTELKSQRERALLAYVADLELEVDRLRKQADFIHLSSTDTIKQLQAAIHASDSSEKLCRDASSIINNFSSILDDVRIPRRQTTRDEVVLFAVRSLADQVFRWQQRALDVRDAKIEFIFDEDHMEWFPARFRHILENLVANALSSYEQEISPKEVRVVLRTHRDHYELEVADHGRFVLTSGRSVSLELYHRASPERSASVGVGLAVVETLVDACGGKCQIDSRDGYANVATVRLPRFVENDYVNE